PTPASDGERVFAFYSSNDLAAFSLNGELLWLRGLALDHPGVGNDIGMASSPVVAGDAFVVQAECQGESFAIAVDRETGATLWEVDRPKDSNWASPLPWTTAEGEPAVWLQDETGATLHDAASGEQLARIDAECGGVVSPSLASDARLVLATGGVSVFAEPFEVPTQTARKLQPGSPSPVVWQNQVLVINRGGVLACGDLETGDVLWRRRLGGRFWATPVAADGRLYCVNAEGEATVVDLTDGGKVLSKADFGEDILGSPAVSRDAVYFRSNGHLWKIAPTQQAATGVTRR
ncbi:MAG: PQQ-binding-like beta-propeller repeat protein, partial [Planctomycetota bacterium]